MGIDRFFTLCYILSVGSYFLKKRRSAESKIVTRGAMMKATYPYKTYHKQEGVTYSPLQLRRLHKRLAAKRADRTTSYLLTKHLLDY